MQDTLANTKENCKEMEEFNAELMSTEVYLISDLDLLNDWVNRLKYKLGKIKCQQNKLIEVSEKILNQAVPLK